MAEESTDKDRAEKKPWTLVGLITAALGTIGFGGVVTIATYLYAQRPADIRARLIVCEPYRIVLETRNRGGGNATLDLPRFAINSTLRPRTELDIPVLVQTPPASRGAVAPGPPVAQPYDAQYPFFSPEEAEAGQCWIFVRIPVSPDGRPPRGIWSSCRCATP